MTDDSKPVEKRHGGRPFQKGADPRRNKAGNLNKEAQSWEIRFRNALAKRLSPEKAAATIIKAYLRAQPWAVDEANCRLIGKVTQPIQADQHIVYRVIYEKAKKEQPSGMPTG